MPNLNDFYTLHERVKKIKDDYGLEKFSHAFDWLALEILFKLNEDQIEESITDGGNDGGIDAIYVNERDVHILNFKYTDDFEKTKNNFPGTEVSKLCTTIDGIMSKTINNKTVNQAVLEKAEEIWEVLKKGGGAINLKIYFCSNKEKLNVADQKTLENHLNKYRTVEYYYYDQEEFVNKLIENKFQRINGELRFVEKDYFDRSDGSLKAIVATVAATDLVNLVKDPKNPNKMNESAFDDNCRVYLKLDNPINQKIYETALSEENYKFYYLNNGVTIVCDKCDYTPSTRSPNASLTNFQIVNGGQTTRSLFEAHQKDSEKIDDVLVLVRICETNDKNITEKISETTNSQTPINNRDLKANDNIQKKLEEQFITSGYFYERKKNQHFEESKEKRLDNELLGQIYQACYLEEPAEAKNQKSKVFGEKYEKIFDENEINASKMLVPYLWYRYFEKLKREILARKRKKGEEVSETETFKSHATFHLVFATKLILELEDLDLEKSVNFEGVKDKAIKFTKEVVEIEKNIKKDDYTHNSFFKGSESNRKIRDYIQNQYKTSDS